MNGGGNNFHTGLGLALRAQKKDKNLLVEELPDRDAVRMIDPQGNQLDVVKRALLACEARSVKSMIRRLFGIVLAVLVLVLVIGSNFL